jgi:hypothetical protein
MVVERFGLVKVSKDLGEIKCSNLTTPRLKPDPSFSRRGIFRAGILICTSKIKLEKNFSSFLRRSVLL